VGEVTFKYPGEWRRGFSPNGSKGQPKGKETHILGRGFGGGHNNCAQKKTQKNTEYGRNSNEDEKSVFGPWPKNVQSKPMATVRGGGKKKLEDNTGIANTLVRVVFFFFFYRHVFCRAGN